MAVVPRPICASTGRKEAGDQGWIRLREFDHLESLIDSFSRTHGIEDLVLGSRVQTSGMRSRGERLRVGVDCVAAPFKQFPDPIHQG